MLKIVNQDSEWSPKYFGIVVGLFCGLYMITTALNAKVFSFYGMVLPAGIIAFPICCVLTDMLTEIYGFNRTRQAIWTAVLCTILFAVFSQMAIALEPASFWENQSAYETIFGMTWRFAIAASMAWVTGEFVNSYVMSKMKIFQNGKHMAVRFIGSTVVGQFVDTAVFLVIAFLGTMPLKQFLIMLVTAWLFKIVYEVVALPLSVPITNWVKKREGVDHFDKQELHLV